jgi:hypothetical protein
MLRRGILRRAMRGYSLAAEGFCARAELSVLSRVAAGRAAYSLHDASTFHCEGLIEAGAVRQADRWLALA